jgi:hypothetical protein
MDPSPNAEAQYLNPPTLSQKVRFRTFVATLIANFVEIPIRNRDDKGSDKGCDEVFGSPGFGDRL